MSVPWHAVLSDRGAIGVGAVLLLVVAAAWVAVVGMSSMAMGVPGDTPGLVDGLTFTALWGVMMAAMMLPSAAPMILLYRTVSVRLAEGDEPVISPAAFAGLYLLVWLATGVPIYAVASAVDVGAGRWPDLEQAIPYGVAAVLAAAGAYQLTPLKRVCLRYCASPLDFLMGRWRGGRAGSARLALAHALYCVGCCWGLMVILFAAGAMSLPWVLLVSLVVLAEKVLPGGGRTAWITGWALLLLAVAVAFRPELAGTLRFPPADAMPDMPMEM